MTVQVTDVNDPPVALNDTFTVFRNTTQNILEVLINDTTGADDPNAESLTVTAVSAGSAGGNRTRPQRLDGTLHAESDFSDETFTYTLSDGRGSTATGNVSVAVNLENPPPTPQNDTFQLQEDAAENLYDVLANDTTNDPSETLSISAVGTSTVSSSVSVSADSARSIPSGPEFQWFRSVDLYAA
ncbi:MAG: Ig-like domain-containing protein [Pirellulaceae bacterium]